MESRLELVIAVPKTKPRVGLYRCSCGEEVIRIIQNVDSGKTKSCGCMRSERGRERIMKYREDHPDAVFNLIHGMYGTPVYWTWANMVQRCTNPNHRQFQSYGRVGVKVCDRWLSFENFYADMGDRPDGMTVERKGEGDYEPDNCVWAPRKYSRSQRLAHN